MSGGYTHITVVNMMSEPARLEEIEGFPEDAIISIMDFFKFCELGALSPDYPYLALDDSGASQWADMMHYERTGEMLRTGVQQLRIAKGDALEKGLAWLLGYAAHVATDVTIHPIVMKKVGPYQENKAAHRVCEMNQDAYIFQRLNLGDIGLAEHLGSGIGICNDLHNSVQLDPDIRKLWENMLADVYPALFDSKPPAISKWHRRFIVMVGKIASSGNRLLPIARHVASGQGLVYPLKNEVDLDYIENLESPEGVIRFDDLFDRAVKNVGTVWSLIARGVLGADDQYLDKIGNWNLDTGCDKHKQFVFWENE